VPHAATNLMGTGLKLKLGLYGERLPTNCLCHGVANTFMWSGPWAIEGTIGVFISGLTLILVTWRIW